MKEKISLLSVLANLILAAGKIAVGFLSNSSAVLAEGIHSFMDIFSSAISYFGIKISQSPRIKSTLMAITNLRCWLVC